MLLVVCGIKAQSDIYVPLNLSEPIVILGCYYSSGWTFTIDDGVKSSPTTNITRDNKTSPIIWYASVISKASNKIVKQGYKLLGTQTVTEGGISGSLYIFQKE